MSPANDAAPRPVHEPESPPFRLQKASDVVAARLRGQILGEPIQVGTELPSEAELMETHGFSRSTVREALRLLEADGLIVTKRGPGGGIRVSSPDINQISRSMAILLTSQAVTHRDFLAFRRLIEPPLAALAAREATAEQRTWLVALAKNEEIEYSGVRASVKFHEAVGVCTNNGVARTVLAAMQSALEGHVRAESLSTDDIHGTTNVHFRIAKLIADGKSDQAARAMERHLEAYAKAVDAKGLLEEPAVARTYWQSQ
jgi:GntR family transcriptional regulator, transcriptional repressor for pyruvate dehydrogenase complex